MDESLKKFCVFCGKKPDKKNKEHILPSWLIKLTGDPNRVVFHGFNYAKNEFFRFDWASLVFPSCSQCNSNYSELEKKVKNIIVTLLARKPVLQSDFILLLDWFDKVRTGMWLGYLQLRKNLVGINPRFFINTRVGIKDRMLAIYPIDNQPDGLNVHAVETLMFQLKPSCFSMRINDLYFLNLSWDFMCSARCGFPFPEYWYIDADSDYAFAYQNIVLLNKIKSPIFRNYKIIKPSIYIFQPIILKEILGEFTPSEMLRKKLLVGSDTNGVLFRQHDNYVEVIQNDSTTIDFNEINESESRQMIDIVRQSYHLQYKTIIDDNFYAQSNEGKLNFKEWKKMIKKEHDFIISNSYQD